MLYKISYAGFSGDIVEEYVVEANTKEEASTISDKVKSIKSPSLYTVEKYVRALKVWNSGDVVGDGFENFEKVLVQWNNGTQDIFETNEDARLYFESEDISYDFSNRSLLKHNRKIGDVFGEGVRALG